MVLNRAGSCDSQASPGVTESPLQLRALHPACLGTACSQDPPPPPEAGLLQGSQRGGGGIAELWQELLHADKLLTSWHVEKIGEDAIAFLPSPLGESSF